MKSTLVMITMVVLFSPWLLINAGEGVIVTGVVETSILDNGDIASVKIDLRQGNEEVFNVVLNSMGKKLGKEMNGKWVEVIGSVRVEDDENWLEVKRYEAVDYFK